MKIESIKSIPGPNVYTDEPVLVATLDLEDLADTASDEIDGFVDRLLALLPGLHEHHCSPGHPGGFVERLRRGTYMGHIVEHIALELSGHAGIEVGFGKTRYAGTPGRYNVVVEYKAEHAMKHLVRAAVEIVEAVRNGVPFDLEACFRTAHEIIEDTELGPSTLAIVEAARKRNIPVRRLNDASLIQLGYGRYRRLIEATVTNHTNMIAVDIAQDKALTKALLGEASIPVPHGTVVRSAEEAVSALGELSPPLVVKPLDGNQGKGVSMELRTEEDIRRAFETASRFCDQVLVEEQLMGQDYRVLVVNGTMVAAAERRPAHVTGDGKHTVQELIELTNLDPRRGEGHRKCLTRINVDDVTTACLLAAGKCLESVPATGEIVVLRDNANLSTGGTATDVTDIVHPEVRSLCERAARLIGLDVCGIDLVMPDISKAPAPGGGIVELNAAPGIRMHQSPSCGTPRDVGGAIVDMLYPPGVPSRIPIIAITGTNGKTTTARLIRHIMASRGLTVGMTSTDGIYIGDQRIATGDMSGPRSARSVLSDPAVDIAVLETARGGIVRNGLGYDEADIGIITNIEPDHIGQDGIESVDDLVHIKALVAEHVRDGGALVLNADNRHAAGMVKRRRVHAHRKTVIYYSMDADNPIVFDHIVSGGTAVTAVDGWIVLHRGPASSEAVVEIGTLPFALCGIAEFHVANCMAAVAAAVAHGVPTDRIAEAVRTFSPADNPGRTNLFRIGEGYVMVDYGHNPDSFNALVRMANRFNGRKVTGVVAVPGDRADSVVEEAAACLAGNFDRIILKEDGDLRGRASGEVALMLYRTIKRIRPEQACIIVLDEYAAVMRAIDEMIPGEVIIVCYEHLQTLMEVLERRGAVAVTSVEECFALNEPATVAANPLPRLNGRL